MANSDNKHLWVRQPQEQEGTYHFSGSFFVTAGVRALLTEDEIFRIYAEIQYHVVQENGLDYLQVFVRESDGRKLFFMDQLSQEMVESGQYRPEDNHCVLMLAEEW